MARSGCPLALPSVGLLAPVLLSAFVAGCGGENTGEDARLLMVSGFTDQVFVLNPDDGSVLDSITTANRPFARDEPHGITVSPDGSRWFLTLAHGEPQLRVHERPGNRLVGALKLPMGGASRIGLTPDARFAFVPDYGRSAGDVAGQVARIRTRTLEITHTARVCPAPHDARVDPSGAVVLVTCAFGSEVVLLAADDLSEIARIEVEHTMPRLPVDNGETHRAMPMNAAWSIGGDRAWVTLMQGDRIVEVSRTGGFIRSIAAGPNPVSLLPTPDGRRLLVTNRGGRSVSIFRLPGLDLEREVDLGDAPHPQGLALRGDGQVAYVSYEGEVGGLGGVIAVRVEDGEILWRTSAGAYVLGIAWLPPWP